MALMNAPGQNFSWGNTFTNPTSQVLAKPPQASISGGGIGVSAQQDAAAGAGFASSAVSAAQSGVDAVLSGKSNIDANLGQLKQSAAAATAAANGMGADIDAVRGQAGKVNDAAAALLPYADKLGGMGDALWGEGAGLYEKAMDIFGQGGALVRMDPSAGGLAGEFINYWNSLSPDRFVSQAASDTQGSFQNAMGQSERDLARRGVSPSSGAYGALKKQGTIAMATALAYAKQKTRQMGYDLQSSQLDKMVAAAEKLYGMGNQTVQEALAAQNAGVGAQKDAAGVVEGAGQLYGTAGNLFGTAGQLGASQASALAGAGGLYGQAANIENQYLNTVNAAYGNLSQANSNVASFYSNLIGTLSRGGGGGGGGGGVNVIDNTNKTIAARQAANPGSSGIAQVVNGRVVVA